MSPFIQLFPSICDTSNPLCYSCQTHNLYTVTHNKLFLVKPHKNMLSGVQFITARGIKNQNAAFFFFFYTIVASCSVTPSRIATELSLMFGKGVMMTISELMHSYGMKMSQQRLSRTLLEK